LKLDEDDALEEVTLLLELAADDVLSVALPLSGVPYVSGEAAAAEPTGAVLPTSS